MAASSFRGGFGSFGTCPSGGGGGSSWVTPRATNVSSIQDTSGVPSVTITPLVPPPTCANVTAASPAGRAVSVTLSCAAPADVAVTYAIRAAPGHGTLGAIDQAKGTVSYTPQAGYTGSDTFTYRATDAAGASNTAAATITIEQRRTSCGDIGANLALGGGAVTLSLSCRDPAGAALTYAIVTGPAHGTLGAIEQASGLVSYTPNAGYGGSDSFTYNATGPGGTSNTATATISISSAPATRLDPELTWRFSVHAGYTTVLTMFATSVPAGASVKVECAGRGCPFGSHIARASRSATAGAANSRTCKRRPCAPKRTRGAKPRTGTKVDLAGLFHGRRLAPGARITVSIVKPGAIGKVYIFTIRASRYPTVKRTCVAAGSSTPGRGC